MVYKMHVIDLKNDDFEFPAIEVTHYAFWPLFHTPISVSYAGSIVYSSIKLLIISASTWHILKRFSETLAVFCCEYYVSWKSIMIII
jgi:hypothetical protein